MDYAAVMVLSVAAVVLDGVSPFELGIVCEVFGTDRRADGFPAYEFTLCSPDGAPVRTSSGFHITPGADLGPLATADLIAVPAHPMDRPIPDELGAALRAAAARGAQVMSLCSGAFVLGEAGLLDGRACTTHWRYVDDLARRFPLAGCSSTRCTSRTGPC